MPSCAHLFDALLRHLANSPDVFWKGSGVNLLLKMEKRGTQHTEAYDSFPFQSGLRFEASLESGLLAVVYDIPSHFLWSFHFTFQPIIDVVDERSFPSYFWFYRVVWPGPCSFVDAYNLHTLENWHGTKEWRFGRWLSVSVGWFEVPR